MPNRFDTTNQKDSGDSQYRIRPQQRGTKSLSDLSAMAAESARLEQLAHIEKQLRENLRSTVFEYRQQGISRSTVPDLRNMTENQILLEVLSKPDWPIKFQKKGIEVNKPILQWISQKLRRIDPSNLLDYNTATRHFNEILDKFKSEDVAELRVEPAGLQGGGGYNIYDKHSQKYYGRIMILTDPKEEEHIFSKGELDHQIAYFTTKWIESYRTKSNKDKALTEEEIEALEEGNNLHGWSCTKLRHFPVQQRVYYTDMGTEIHALDLSSYQPYSREEHNKNYSHLTLGEPTSIFNCFSDFIDRKAWLVSEACFVSEKSNEYMQSRIQRILDENGYNRVSADNAQIGDIVAYYEQGGNISHTATIARIDLDRITVESKPGAFGLIQHDMYDSDITQEYGEPSIYHTERQGGHLLRTVRPWLADLLKRI